MNHQHESPTHLQNCRQVSGGDKPIADVTKM